MTSRVHFRPWSYFASAALIAMGLALVLDGRFGPAPRLEWAAAAVVAGGVIEVVAGLSFRRRGGAFLAPMFSGTLVTAFALYLLSQLWLDPRSITPAPVALLFGVFCLANAIFRGLDVAIDRPSAMLSEAIDVSATLMIGIALCAFWRAATPSFVAIAAGLELIAGGISLAGSARLLFRHPELQPYETPT